ncbi:unnamed protein product [Miscanthus lutarioriparius]|uniref:Uncharacterized protein n=1 Tax=Miscanthus lutarioriparius TaxID=422564 RepID=A0A811MBT4_9POAL|nr:unnamed protein product [Miscanthus lutarioriparius]
MCENLIGNPECLSDREPIHAHPSTSPPAPAATPKKPEPAHREHTPLPTPCGSPVAPSVDLEEEELLDYGEAEEIDAIDALSPAAFEAEDGMASPDLQPRQAQAPRGLRSDTPSASATSPPRSGGSADGGRPAVSDSSPPPSGAISNASIGARAPTKLKSILVRPDRVATPPDAPADRRKLVWHKLALTATDVAAADWQNGRRKHWWPKDAALQKVDPGSRRLVTGAEDGALRGALTGQDAFKRRLSADASGASASTIKLPSAGTLCTASGARGLAIISHATAPPRHRQPISANLRARLTFPAGSIHSRITFPPLCSTAPASSPATQITSSYSPRSLAEMDPMLEHDPGHALHRPRLIRSRSPAPRAWTSVATTFQRLFQSAGLDPMLELGSAWG